MAINFGHVFSDKQRKPATLTRYAGFSSDIESILTFQYYPDSIQDSKQVNWTEKQPFQSSLPIYQWVSSGARSIQFTAYFTSDKENTTKRTIFTATGFAEADVYVNSYLKWLRENMLPTYYSNGTIQSPPLLKLSLPGSSIGDLGGGPDKDEIYCIMTQCEINIGSLFPGGEIRTATAQLTFMQVPQFNGTIQYPARKVIV